jgi:hypothetical protein
MTGLLQQHCHAARVSTASAGVRCTPSWNTMSYGVNNVSRRVPLSKTFAKNVSSSVRSFHVMTRAAAGQGAAPWESKPAARYALIYELSILTFLEYSTDIFTGSMVSERGECRIGSKVG